MKITRMIVLFLWGSSLIGMDDDVVRDPFYEPLGKGSSVLTREEMARANSDRLFVEGSSRNKKLQYDAKQNDPLQPMPKQSPSPIVFASDVHDEYTSGMPREVRSNTKGKGFNVVEGQERQEREKEQQDESDKNLRTQNEDVSVQGRSSDNRVVKPSQKLSQSDLKKLRDLKKAFESPSYQEHVLPILRKICDIDQLTQLVDDVTKSEAITQEHLDRMKQLLAKQKSFAQIKDVLAREKITVQQQQVLLDFVTQCKTVLDSIMKLDSAMDDFIKVVAKELPYESLENLLSNSISSVSRSNFEISTGVAQFLTILTLVALSTSIAALLIALGNKFHVKGLTDVGIGIIVVEVVMGCAVLGVGLQ